MKLLTISQDKGSRHVFKPIFSRKRRMDLAPTHLTLKNCNLKHQFVTMVVAEVDLRACFPTPCLSLCFSCCWLGISYLCRIPEISAISLETTCQSQAFISPLKSVWRAECSLNNFSHIGDLSFFFFFFSFTIAFRKKDGFKRWCNWCIIWLSQRKVKIF